MKKKIKKNTDPGRKRKSKQTVKNGGEQEVKKKKGEEIRKQATVQKKWEKETGE